MLSPSSVRKQLSEYFLAPANKQKASLKEEAIANLVGALITKEFLADRYPLGRFGSAQVVDHAVSMMR